MLWDINKIAAMPIKTEPVPVHTEEAAADAAVVSEQVDAEKKEEEPKDAPEKQIPKAKAKRVAKKALIEPPPAPVEPGSTGSVTDGAIRKCLPYKVILKHSL